MKRLMVTFAVVILALILPYGVSAGDLGEKASQSFFDGRFVIKSDDSLWDLAQDEPCMILENVDTLKIGNRITEKNFFAICKDGTLWGWGENTHGSLGIGTEDYQEKPVKISGDVISVSFVKYNTFALKKDGSLWAWGENGPCLGMKTEKDQLTPVKIMDGVKTIYTPVSLAVFAKCEDDTLWGWGHNYDLIDHGESVLGIKTQESVQYTPIKMMDDVKTMDAVITTPGVGAFVYRAMVVKNDGTIWGWGEDNGQMPPRDTTNKGEPVLMLEKVSDINMSTDYSFVVDDKDNVWIYARFHKGHIGPYSLGWSEKIEKCMGSGIKTILPWHYTLMKDETFASWTYMLMKDGTIRRFSDSEEKILADHVTDIYSSWQGGTMFFFKKEDSSLWGYCNDYEGDRTFTEKVMDDVEEFCSEGGASYAIKTDGSLWVWGLWPYIAENEIDTPTKVFDGVRVSDKGDENITTVDISKYTESENYHVEKIINTNYGKVLYFWFLGTPHGKDPGLLLVRPDGSEVYLSTIVSRANFWTQPELDDIALSNDGKTLTFSASFSDRAQVNMGEPVVLHDAGTYYYASNLETGETIKTRFEPLPVISEDIISSWAKPEVEKAIELGIVPISFRENYKRNITRGEFARLAMYFLSVQYGYQAEHMIETYYHIGKKLDMRAFMNAYCAVKTDRNGEPFEGGDKIYTSAWNSVDMPTELYDVPFTDVSHPEQYYIGMAYNIGIVNGVSETKFDPDGEITRQEAAAMLMRAYKIYADFQSPDIGFRYSDNDKIAAWAKDDVYALNSLGVMKGLSEDVFGPNDKFTIEQAIATFLRLYESAPISRKNENIGPLFDTEFEINKYFDRGSMYFHEEERMEFEKYTIVYGGWTIRHRNGLDYDLYVFYKNGGMKDLTSFVPIAQSNYEPITDIEVNEADNTITFSATIADTFRLYNSLYGAEHVYDIGRYRIKTDLETGNIIDLEYLGKEEIDEV